ncbi:UPF0193 protein EVG1 [Aulostomus maculatus]
MPLVLADDYEPADGLAREPAGMATSSPNPVSNPRASQYSKETQDMLKSMMQDSRLTNLQRQKINQCLKNGASLPSLSLMAGPTSLASDIQFKPSTGVVSGRPQRRSADACRAGNSYVRERFQPSPKRDLAKEKDRLQCIMATGQEPVIASSQNVAACPSLEVTEDLYEEVLGEIEERRQFLADMASLGQEKQYIHIINTEISQKIKELEMLDKAQRIKKEAENI